VEESSLTNISVKSELIRKGIHIASSVIPLSYLFLDKNILLYVLVPSVCVKVVIEILKYKSDAVFSLYQKFFGSILRVHEQDKRLFRLNGAAWMMLAYVLCIIFFPRLIAITGMLFLAYGDSLSALAGKFLGKKHFVPDRTFIGSFTFFIVACAVVFLLPKYSYLPKEYLIGCLTALIATVADTLKLPVDDNFSIPIVSCGALYVFYLIFFPGIF